MYSSPTLLLPSVYVATCTQVETEFCLMCGNDATETITENW